MEKIDLAAEPMYRAEEVQGQDEPPQQGEEQPAVPVPYNRENTCWRCKQPGHDRFTCQRPSIKFCSQCGRNGILTKDCHPPLDNLAPFAKSCHRIKFTPRPYITVHLRNRSFHALLNTGSELSFINLKTAKAARKMRFQPVRQDLEVQLIDKSLTCIPGYIILLVKIQGQLLNHVFYIMPTLQSAMLIGMDLWTHLGLMLPAPPPQSKRASRRKVARIWRRSEMLRLTEGQSRRIEDINNESEASIRMPENDTIPDHQQPDSTTSDDQPHDQAPDQPHNQAPDQLHNQLPDQLLDQPHDQPLDQSEDQLLDQLPDQPHDQLLDQPDDQLPNQLPDQSHDQLLDQPDDQLPDQLFDQPYGQPFDQLHDQPPDQPQLIEPTPPKPARLPPVIVYLADGLSVAVPYSSAHISRKYRADVGSRRFVIRFDRAGRCRCVREIHRP